MKFPRPSPTLRLEARAFLKLVAMMLPMAALAALLALIPFILQNHPAILAAIGVVAVFAFTFWAAFWPVKE